MREFNINNLAHLYSSVFVLLLLFCFQHLKETLQSYFIFPLEELCQKPYSEITHSIANWSCMFSRKILSDNRVIRQMEMLSRTKEVPYSWKGEEWMLDGQELNAMESNHLQGKRHLVFIYSNPPTNILWWMLLASFY